MCLRNTYSNPEAERLRRKGVILAASCASFSSLPVLFNVLPKLHQYRLFEFALIGIQVACIALALRFIARANRIERGQ